MGILDVIQGMTWWRLSVNKYETWLMNRPKPEPKELPTWGTTLGNYLQAMGDTVPTEHGRQVVARLTAIYNSALAQPIRVVSHYQQPRVDSPPPRGRAEHREAERVRTNHCDFRDFLGYGQGQRRRS